ncbi:winged helix-turn-helix domain-containing protein [Aliihoeflea sp. PC F10.4]
MPIDDALRIDEAAGIIVNAGQFAVLTPQEKTLFQKLRSAGGRLVTRQSLLEELYQLEAHEPEIKIVDVYVCKIRRKLKPLGLTILTEWGKGYRFVPVTERKSA